MIIINEKIFYIYINNIKIPKPALGIYGIFIKYLCMKKWEDRRANKLHLLHLRCPRGISHCNLLIKWRRSYFLHFFRGLAHYFVI
jgi:hypothetical protein